MNKKHLLVVTTLTIILSIPGIASATLITIGTATYNGSQYNLIWENQENGHSVVWLDYSNYPSSWYQQTSWAAGLNDDNVLTYHFFSNYRVYWGQSNPWRLPSAYNPMEMAYLFYNGLDVSAPTTNESLNVSNFNNLIASWYWTSTSDAYFDADGYYFDFRDAYMDIHRKGSLGYGLAIRTGSVYVVPEPATMLLFGTAIAGLTAVGRRKRS